MSARDIAIDTLTFADLLKLGLEDLPGASQGEWTQHGPIDPGIAILELLSWQFEQRLFMADQLTEPIVRASLRLLGVPDPQPARPAGTVLSIRTAGLASSLPAGTVFGLDRDDRGRRLALDDELWAQPVTGVEVAGRMWRSGDMLELKLAGDPGGGAGAGTLSLLVELDAPPGTLPAWRIGAATDVRPPAELRWDAVGPDGATSPVQLADTTGALRRSGVLRLPWAAVWDRPGDGPRLLRATATAASYTEPVRVLGVHPNAAPARDRVPPSTEAGAAIDQALARQLGGFLALPDQLLRVPGAAGRLCDADGDIVLSVVERDGTRHEWRGVRTLVGSGPADRVMLVDRERGELRFGDGRSGRILRPAVASDPHVTCFFGAGSAGNVGRMRAWAQEDGAAVAHNPLATEDGAEPESLDAARQRAADALAARDRTVTERDARELAQATPGLGLRRAHAAPGFHPAFPCAPVPGALTVTIVPHADRGDDPASWTAAPRPDDGALATTRERLERARLLGQEIFVLPPVYRRVAVGVAVSATARAGDAGGRIVDALRRYLDPLVGGPEHEGWPFGGPVRPSALAEIVQRTIGPEATVVRLQASLDGGVASDCADLAIGPRELVWLDAATIDWVAAPPTRGGLR